MIQNDENWKSIGRAPKMTARCQPATGAPHAVHLYATSRSSRGQGRAHSCSAQSTSLSKQNSCSAQEEVSRRSTPLPAVILATVRTLSAQEERKNHQVRGNPGSRLLQPRCKRKPLPSTGSFTVATAACSRRTAEARLSPGHIVKDRVPFLTNTAPGHKASPCWTLTTEARDIGFAMGGNLQRTVSASSFCRPQHHTHWQVAELLIKS